MGHLAGGLDRKDRSVMDYFIMHIIKNKHDISVDMKTLSMEGLDTEGFVKLCEEIFSSTYKSKVKRSFLFEDKNVDFLIVSKNIAVYCDHPSNSPIGRPGMEKIHLAMKKKKIKECIVVTSRRFASTAQKYIDEKKINVTLVDFDALTSIAVKVGIKLVYKKDTKKEVKPEPKKEVKAKPEPKKDVPKEPKKDILKESKKEVPKEIKKEIVKEFDPDEPNAFTIISNSDREFREHLAKRLKNELQCTEDISLNIAIKNRNITLVPYFKISYHVDAEFTAAKMIIHREKGEGQFYINDRTGKIEDEEFSKIYDMVPRMAYDPPGKDPEFFRPKKQAMDTVYDRVQKDHTKYVPYVKKEDKVDTKKCVPSKKDITITDVMCLYLPLSDVEYELFGKPRTIRSLESSTPDFTIIGSSVHKCDLCNKSTEKGMVCTKCKKVACEKHGVLCSRCSKTLCVECSLAVVKFLGKKEPICGACANKEPGLKIKDYK